MRSLTRQMFLAAFTLFTARALCAASYEPSAEAGPREVATIVEDWTDAKRQDRKVPVKVYYPKGSDRCPVIIFSHGLGGTREGYEYVGRYWASHGFVSVHLQHLGSDDAVWKDAPPAQRLAEMKKATMNLRAALDRPKDVTFAIDTLERLNKDSTSALKGRLDLDRLGMAGHSFGGWTTLAAGGQTFAPRLGRGINLGDDRIKAMIPMSAPPGRDSSQHAESFKSIKIPAMHMTGTLDDSQITDTTPEDRRKAYEHTPGPAQGGKDQYLINFEGGDHSIFSGARWPGAGKGDPKKDKTFYLLIQRSTLAFWDAYLRDNKEALAWLQGDAGMKKMLGKHAELELKKKQ